MLQKLHRIETIQVMGLKFDVNVLWGFLNSMNEFHVGLHIIHHKNGGLLLLILK